MINAFDVYKIIDEYAPFINMEDYDNSGVIYNSGKSTNRVLFALDITSETVNEAIKLGCGILVSHHPVMFGGITKLRFSDPVAVAIRNDISLVAAHTNYDKAKPGTSDILAQLLDITVDDDICEGTGRVGYTKREFTSIEFINYVKDILNLKTVSAVAGTRDIRNVAIIAGSSGNISELYDASIDAVITGETKYFHAVEASHNGTTLIVLGHFASENPGFMKLYDIVRKQVGEDVECIYSEVGEDPYSYY